MFSLVPKESLIGVLVGPILWSLYFLISYVASGLVCSLGYSETTVAGMNPVQLVLLIAGIVIGLLVIATALQAQRGRRHLRTLVPENEDDESYLERQGFLYTTSLLLCGFALLGILWIGLAAAIAPVC